MTWRQFESIRDAFYEDRSRMQELTCTIDDRSAWISVEVITKTGKSIRYTIREDLAKHIGRGNTMPRKAPGAPR
jgi:hypothetical protein